ncbi:lipid-A-disaccharide synthase [Spirochaetia bacterium]|nr:lipid-A-disaccharide synthase [Spirochaetia bacterium]
MKKKIFIIAGEVSGDVIGAKIINYFCHPAAPQGSHIIDSAMIAGGVGRPRDLGNKGRAVGAKQCAKFVGIGGESMKVAGLKTLFPISDLSVMGVFEVLAKSKTLLRRINETAAAIIAEKPDIVLTIDSPSFAVRVIKKVKKKIAHCSLLTPRFYHVVAPMVWAWGPWRAKKYAKIFDKLFCFFDFEKPYFEKYGLSTIAIGHPIYDGLSKIKNKKGKIISLVPGSRISEVKKLLPILRDVAEQLPNKKFAIPVVETTREYVSEQVRTWKVKPQIIPAAARYKLFAESEFAIAASGTVVAELAIIRTPTIVIYKMNPLTQILAKLVMKTKYVSLVNILADKMIFPELLKHKANAKNIICEIKNINPAKMKRELAAVDKLWHKSASPTELIARHL